MEATHKHASKMRVRVKLNGVIVRLNNEGELLATISFSTADVAVLMRGATMRVAARLGSLSLVDNQLRSYGRPEFAKVLAIEGDELADFAYETFDPKDTEVYPGYDSSVWLRTGSLRFTVLEEPLQDLMQFARQFSEMRTSPDTTQNASSIPAVSSQAADSEQQASKMHYDVIIKTPIVVLPRSSEQTDVVVANLGEIYAHNTFFDGNGEPHKTVLEPGEGLITKITAGVRHVRLASRMSHGEQESKLQMINDVNLAIDMVQTQGVECAGVQDQPDTQVRANLSDVSLRLTEEQYCFLIELSRSVPRAFSQTSQDSADSNDLVETKTQTGWSDGANRPASAQPLSATSPVKEANNEASGHAHATLDLLFAAHAIQLEIYDGAPTRQEDLPNASLARFALNDAELKLKKMYDESMEAELALRSFTVRDTRVHKKTKFREIVPAIQHDGHQFMLSYSASAEGSGLLLVTIDSPKIIFALDPMFALRNFWMSPFASEAHEEQVPNASNPPAARADRSLPPAPSHVDSTAEVNPPAQPSFAYRVNVVAPTIILLANSEKADSEAIVLSIKQVLISQQVVLALTVDQFGMFMCRMTRPKDTVRLLDNFNMAVSVDSGSGDQKQTTSIDAHVEPLVFRIALRDVRLISSVVNEAIKLSNESSTKAGPSVKDTLQSRRQSLPEQYQSNDNNNGSDNMSEDAVTLHRPHLVTSDRESDEMVRPHLLVSKEVLNIAFSGLQVVVIGELHGLPILDLNVGETNFSVQDWSSDIRVSAAFQTRLNYYNLSRSHWEPLFDPWSFNFGITSDAIGDDQNISRTISSNQRLELNISTTFIDTIAFAVGVMSDENQRIEASRNAAPFKIVNRTGYRISVWAEHHGQRVKPQPAHLADGAFIPWTFDDWKTMREVSELRICDYRIQF